MKLRITVLIALIGLSAFFYFNRDREAIVPLPRPQQRVLTSAIATAIIKQEPLAEFVLPDPKGEVFLGLALSDGSKLLQVMGKADSWAAAAKDAIKRVGRSDGFAMKWLRVDFLKQRFRQTQWEDGRLYTDLPIGTVGFEETRGQIWLPMDLVVHRKWHKKGYLSKKRFEGLKDNRLQPFSTEAFAWIEGEVLPLYRGHRERPEEIDATQLRQSLRLAEQYLWGAISEKGEYDYVYDPLRDRISRKYNILRHGGTTWSLLQLFRWSKNPESLRKAELALDMLVRNTVLCPQTQDRGLCVKESGSVKLGANGLALLAMSLHHHLTQSTKYLQTMQGYARRIQEIQKPTGEFKLHKQAHPSGKDSGFVSGYYPGEAIFGLTALYEIDGNKKWLGVAAKAAKWLINVRDGDKTSETIAHDHWLLYGLERLDELQPSPEYRTQSEKITEAIIKSQNRSGFAKDEIGSWYGQPRSTPAATRVEGLMAAYKLFKRHGDTDRMQAIREVANRSLRYQLNTQIFPELALYLSNPARSLGGFREGLLTYDVRIDYVQHNVSAILDYLGTLKSKN